MKKLVILLSLLAVVFVMTAAVMAQDIEKYDPEKTYGDPENPYGPMHVGSILVEFEDADSGLGGRFVTYNAAGSGPCPDVLVVLAPDGVTAEALYQDSEWAQIADDGNFSVSFIEAPGGKWNLEEPEDNIQFIEKVFSSYLGGKLFLDWNERALYLIGYGEGGAMASEYAMYYPARLSGYMTIGAPAVPAAYLNARTEDPGSYPFIHSGSKTYLENFANAEIPVPVWIVAAGEQDEALVEYWKNANNTVDAGLTNGKADVFKVNTVSANDLNTDQLVADVWVSSDEDALTYSSEDNAAYWAFLSLVRRFGGNPGTSLRASFEPEDLGMVKVDVEVDGLPRFFYVYTPTYYTGEEALPLVLASHGYSSTGAAFTGDSEWWRLAEKRNFMVVFTQAYPHKGNNVPVWYTNNTTLANGLFNGTEEQNQADIDYYLAVLDYMDANYNLDKTRVYNYGHSNGSMMSSCLADNIPEKFAAVSMDSGWDVAWGGDPEAYNDSVKLAFFATTGGVESLGTTIVDNEKVQAQIDRYCHANGLSYAEADKTTYVDGRYEITTVYDGIVPIVRFGFVENGMHAATPDECSLVWDLCFSKFSRGEDGALYYEGVEVK